MAHFYDGQSHSLHSRIYRWNSSAGAFDEHQALPSNGAWDLTAFQLGGEWYLAVASFFDGHSRELNSTVYRWDADADAFVLHQQLPTIGAMDVEFFGASGGVAEGASGAAFMAFTGGGNGRGSARAECAIFVWTGTAFRKLQTLEISGGHDSEAFQVDDGETVVFVVVHEESTDVYSAPVSRLRASPPPPPQVDGLVASGVPESAGGASGGAAAAPGVLADETPAGGAGPFVLLQRLAVPHGRDAAHFRLGGAEHLALAVSRDEASHVADSRVYRWSVEGRRLEEFQRLRTEGASDVEPLLDGGMLAVGGGSLAVCGQISVIATWPCCSTLDGVCG